jgi:hypothetical protein
MSARRRRARRPDPLASVEAVRAVLEHVSTRVSGSKVLPQGELVRILRAASHRERSGWRDSRQGRRARYDVETLRHVWSALAEELGRETGSSVSPRTFTEHYLRVLGLPADVLAPLRENVINLFEALQLARVKPSRELSPSAAAGLRRRILQAHLAANGSARQLYERIDVLLKPEPATRASLPHPVGFTGGADALDDDSPSAVDDLAEAYLADPGALFADQLRQVTLALAELEGESIDEADATAILDLLDQVYLRATRAARRARGNG